MKKSNNTRRDFLGKMMMGGAGMTALSMAQLKMIESAVAEEPSSSLTGYKALVCVYLAGGNDGFNTLIPMRGKQRTDYLKARGVLGRGPVESLLEINPTSNIMEGGLGFVPEMSKLKELFDSGNLAVQANVGSLIQPITKEQVRNRSVPVPRQLYSHNSQQDTWQRGAELNQANTGQTGWAGRMLDSLAPEMQQNFMNNISYAGSNIWQSGNSITPFSAKVGGAKSLKLFNESKHVETNIRTPSIRKYFADGSQFEHPLMKEYAEGFVNADANTTTLIAASKTRGPNPFDGFPSGNALAKQLKEVARLIELRKNFGVDLPRQVFFVSLGGFDTHDNQLENHPVLLKTLSDAMAAFYESTVHLGIENDVTTFTMSDFGRTLTPNAGDGTDHGWGNHQFILGGAVDGDIYGTMPTSALHNSQDLGGGRMLPTTASEQMFASLAKWYGLSDAQCLEIFPNLKAFDQDEISYFS